MRLAFVVGTGRCGSTMLSAILREHPDVLSLSEFFGTVRAAAQPQAQTSAGHGLFPAGLPAAATLGELAAALPERYRGLVFPPYDAARLMAYPIPVTAFGRYRWSPMICAGVDALAKLPPGGWLPLRYEDLLRDPAASLTALAEFIGIDAPRSWLAAARKMIDPAKSGAAAAQLDPATLAALRAACAPGERALPAATAQSMP